MLRKVNCVIAKDLYIFKIILFLHLKYGQHELNENSGGHFPTGGRCCFYLMILRFCYNDTEN